jgi:uncharacterized protein (DUF2236 family)
MPTGQQHARPKRISLSTADRDRLQTALVDRTLDPARSLFGPATITWRINREAALLLGGGCALLLQVAHPLVAAGVAAHSRFTQNPLQRLWRTLDLVLTITFADAASAIRAVRAIERVHARVHGTLDADVGPFARGTAYDANAPELLLWVHATLVHTAMQVYELFVEPLSMSAKGAYYRESKLTARLLAIPDSMIPSTLGEFRAYVTGMLRGNTLAVGAAGRTIAASILDPPVPALLKPAFRIPNLLSIGLLPPVLRQRYGFAWGAGRERALRMLVAALRPVLPRLPDLVRFLPHARAAAAVATGEPRGPSRARPRM